MWFRWRNVDENDIPERFNCDICDPSNQLPDLITGSFTDEDIINRGKKTVIDNVDSVQNTTADGDDTKHVSGLLEPDYLEESMMDSYETN